MKCWAILTLASLVYSLILHKGASFIVFIIDRVIELHCVDELLVSFVVFLCKNDFFFCQLLTVTQIGNNYG